jgi:hypothetical protein
LYSTDNIFDFHKLYAEVKYCNTHIGHVGGVALPAVKLTQQLQGAGVVLVSSACSNVVLTASEALLRENGS